MSQSPSLPIEGTNWQTRILRFYRLCYEKVYGSPPMSVQKLTVAYVQLSPLIKEYGETIIGDLLLHYVGMEDWDDGYGQLKTEPVLNSMLYPLHLFPARADRVKIYMRDILHLPLTLDDSKKRVRMFLEKM